LKKGEIVSRETLLKRSGCRHEESRKRRKKAGIERWGREEEKENKKKEV